ncbi:hypothetical protein WR25_06226 [Diploscapter pachys]|uniref:DNA primase n=1 Tax=Diploscapter pachys TaxID=2018661 RepID=A0A2A2M0X0_9BILA|nr:hypothetical protein WR25_06226 [Diploscapter pachys]
MDTPFDHNSLSLFLRTYYKSIFPYKQYLKWMTYGLKFSEYCAYREFAFILHGDIHLRYKNFYDSAMFERELCNTNPEKLDIGAIYNHHPREHKKHLDMKALERELIFDIDLTDYSGVRHCCGEATVCKKCWKFIVVGVKVLDYLLAEDFGFQARMWVFSGRRGVHCWVADKAARQLDNEGRGTVAEYLNLYEGNKPNVMVNISDDECEDDLDRSKLRQRGGPSAQYVPHVVQRAYRKMMESGVMDDLVHEQGWLSDDKLNDVHKCFPQASDSLKEELRMLKDLSEKNRWVALKRRYDEVERAKAEKKGLNVPAAPSEQDRYFLYYFVIHYAFPRLDIHVSTGVNHLLKSPFCIHPKTGNVAVPLNTDKIHEFDVTSAPRIDKLIKELNESNSNAMETDENMQSQPGYKRTSLAPFVENFERFVTNAVASEK